MVTIFLFLEIVVLNDMLLLVEGRVKIVVNHTKVEIIINVVNVKRRNIALIVND
jgi:hypothetical protein